MDKGCTRFRSVRNGRREEQEMGLAQHGLISWLDSLRPHDNHYDVMLPIYVVESDTALPIRPS